MAEIESYAVRRPSGYGLTLFNKPNDLEIDGYVETTLGYVRCFSTDYTGTFDGKRRRWTSLSVVIGGRIFHARIERFYTKRGLVTVAQRFAEQAAKETSNV
jgi:hypothetical protein